MVHYSKEDPWLVASALAAIGVPVVLGILFLLFGNGTREAGRLLIIIGALTGAVLLGLTYPLYYLITPSELIIRCGILMRRQIPLASIDEVGPDKSPLSAPAWSLDRLRINYRKNGTPTFIMISPNDTLAFLQELAEGDAGLNIRNDRFVSLTARVLEPRAAV